MANHGGAPPQPASPEPGEGERERELFFEVFDGLARLGPGSRQSTLLALGLIGPLPAGTRTLDVGCGRGAQSLVLAEAIEGTLTAVDDHAPFLEDLEREACSRGLAERLETRRADMARLPFPEASFDLLWSEGSIYLLGFERGLELWRPLLRPGGGIAVTELSWLRPAPPAELAAFWREAYPGMASVEANRASLHRAGFAEAGHFALEAAAWDAFYESLEARLAGFRAAHAGDPLAARVAQGLEKEIHLYRRYAPWYGYVFYVARHAG